MEIKQPLWALLWIEDLSWDINLFKEAHILTEVKLVHKTLRETRWSWDLQDVNLEEVRNKELI